ncbi:hypothetical protein CTRI78_v000331 [Colletotrichum trifolii]|uniref:Uncharacterized protein n=1 Tax=Colletotrichum trifolii TaxID=5466 RepID=A0A4R8RY88_COLTR|nr:hypothetical protein CTRI78_v000331 [Colletotrichum trifolii]
MAFQDDATAAAAAAAAKTCSSPSPTRLEAGLERNTCQEQPKTRLLPPDAPTCCAAALHKDSAEGPPFSSYLQIVSFTATITVSVSISASTAFATSQSLYGIDLTSSTDPETAPAAAAALTTVRRAAGWHSWAAAASSVSLMMALILQLMQTDRLFLRALQRKKPSFFKNVPRLVTGVGSWIALALQASALVMIGQALKAIDNQSGSVIQWTMLALGVPSVIVHFAHNRLGYDFDFGGFRASCC